MKVLGLLGAALMVVGLLLFAVPPTQSVTCAQSIVRLVTYCPVSSSYVDSIQFNGITLAPVLNNNPVYVGQTSGTLTAYYFLAQGAVLSSKSASWCSGVGCIPNQSLGTVTSGMTSASVPYLSVSSPTMVTGGFYRYQFSITDSLGTTSTLSDSIIVQAQATIYTATVSVVNGTYALAGANPVNAFNVYAGETALFTVTQTNNAAVTSISLNIAPYGNAGSGISMYQISSTVWRAFATFPSVGSYTVTAVDSNSQTIFSVRATVVTQRSATLISITSASPTLTLTQTNSGTATTYLCGSTTCTTVISSSGSSTTFVSTQTTGTVAGNQSVAGFPMQYVLGAILTMVGGFLFIRGRKR